MVRIHRQGPTCAASSIGQSTRLLSGRLPDRGRRRAPYLFRRYGRTVMHSPFKRRPRRFNSCCRHQSSRRSTDEDTRLLSDECWFKSSREFQGVIRDAREAQRIERRLPKPKVCGFEPRHALHRRVSSEVERLPNKQEVAGSTPASGTRF
jgi:hypothetical protein